MENVFFLLFIFFSIKAIAVHQGNGKIASLCMLSFAMMYPQSMGVLNESTFPCH